MKFRDLKIGQSFDFINDARPALNSFFRRCVKVSPRQYETKPDDGNTYTVGSGNAEVFHVGSVK